MNQSTTNLRRRWIAAFSALWTALLCATPLHAIEAVGETPASDNESGIQITLPEGLPTADWLSIRAVYEAGRHAFEATDGGWQARNPGQRWETFFDRRGFLVEPQGGGWQWGLELCRYGFPGAERLVGGTPAVKAEGQRLTYDWDDAVQEWFVNDARGLEHGFTVRERPNRPEGPQTRSNSLLRFTLTTRGTLAPHVANDAQSVTYQDAAGAAVLTYSGLKVWDADGKVLPSGFETTGKEGVYLWVDEHGARYPLTIDPIAQQAYLKAHQVSTIDFFGSSVAISGDTVVVGAISEDSSTTGINSTPNESGNAAGAAYVFVRNGTTWTQQAYLKAHYYRGRDAFGTNFGRSVAISGDTVVVGADGEDSGTTGVNSTPTEENYLLDSGAAYVFVRNGTTWTQQAYLKASQVARDDFFGWSVAVSGDTVVVGAYGRSDYQGIAYVFVRSEGAWIQQASLGNQGNSSDAFGRSVAISGDTVVVGADGEDSSTTGVNSTPDESANSAGAAYVFVRSGTLWSRQAYLKAHQVTAGDHFGSSVAISGDTVAVGARSRAGSGAAYVFVRDGGMWAQQASLRAHQFSIYDEFGSSIAISGDTLVVGAQYEDGSGAGIDSIPNEDAPDAGAAYVFLRSGTTWTQQAYLKAHQVSEYDRFGRSVAVFGDTVVVGAPEESSSTTGVNSIPDEAASRAGAAYVFTGFGPPPEMNPNVTIDLVSDDQISLAFDTVEGFDYDIEYTDDLIEWKLLLTIAGDGTRKGESFSPPEDPTLQHYRIAIRQR